ncbi:MAG: shikimate dehydrogenase [Hydrotalea sp.]|nr:shikimate dehydrogenase [Hydrotalea sp.]
MQNTKSPDNFPVAGVIGHPITHSLSPALHNHWLKKMGLPGRYESRDVAPADCARFFADLRNGKVGWVGCNVTLPHKIVALDHCDVLSDAAKKIGAVNTIIVRNGKLHGDNTDWLGFSENLLSWAAFRAVPKNRAVVIGAGGAARGVIYGLQQLGFGDIIVVNRTVEKLQDLRDDFGIAVDSLASLPKHIGAANLLVNATSLGLKGEMLPVDFTTLPRGILLHDIIYGAHLTHFLTTGKEFGFAVKDGLGMLIHQGIPGFKAWFKTDKNPPVDDDLRHYLLSQKK